MSHGEMDSKIQKWRDAGGQPVVRRRWAARGPQAVGSPGSADGGQPGVRRRSEGSKKRSHITV